MFAKIFHRNFQMSDLFSPLKRKNVFSMCKALGSLSFSLIHMSYLTYFCTKLNFKYQKYQVCLNLQVNMHRSLTFSFLPFIHLSIHLYCMPFTISNFYFNFSIVPVRGRLEDIGKSLHSKVKRFDMQTCC